MAELVKYKASEVAYRVKHNFRELPFGKKHGNESINPDLTKYNHSLIEGRCQTAAESNKYRKDLEKEIFKYNRKNLVHAVEIVVQCPTDCPADQKDAFFKETYRYICSTLPMGERCIFAAQIHEDEKHYSPTGEMISKDHLHVMYIPAVKDSKHEGYEYRLCADQLTKKSRLKAFHPGLQKHLDNAGIKATVYRKREGDGKSISLSVAQLKELTAKTGISLDHSLTVDELSAVINSNLLHEEQITQLQGELKKKTETIELLAGEISLKNLELKSTKNKLAEKAANLEKIQLSSEEKDQTVTKLREEIKTRDSELNATREKNAILEAQMKEMQKELDHTRTHSHDHEISQQSEHSKEEKKTERKPWDLNNIRTKNSEKKFTLEEEILW